MITEVPGVRVGHAQRTGDGWLTGVTVVVPPPGTVGAVDVRGGGPGTHETDALAPGTLVDTVDAVVLTGGSAYGLVAAHGVQRWCEEQGLGFPVGVRDDGRPVVVPIVPAACIFDLGRGGDWDARPDAEMGYAAASSAALGCAERGRSARGRVRGRPEGRRPAASGTGSCGSRAACWSAALAVVNAAGVVGGGSPPSGSGDAALNTTLAVVVTNARLDVAEATRAAGAGHDGLARSIDPVHTLSDGDTVFVLATGEIDSAAAAPEVEAGWPGAQRVMGVATVQAAAAEAVRLAVLDAVGVS